MFFFRRKSAFKTNNSRRVKLLSKILVIILLICIGAVWMASQHIEKIVAVSLPEQELQNVFADVLPGTAGLNEPGFDGYVHTIINAITGIDSFNPAIIIASELNIAYTEEAISANYLHPKYIEEEGGEEDFYLPEQEQLDDWISAPDPEFPPVDLTGEPMVIIYNTHNAETYKPSDGTSRVEGKNGGVAAVSEEFSRVLENKCGIKTVYSDVIHDYPDWTKSYLNSMKTAKQLIIKYPKAQLVLDIHRDAGLEKRADTLVKINGKNCAKIMIVIGTGHPQWKENLAFAEKLVARADECYPGLIKCIRLRKNRRYNQHLHPRALLLEVGSDLNTREDALQASYYMADVIGHVLKNQ